MVPVSSLLHVNENFAVQLCTCHTTWHVARPMQQLYVSTKIACQTPTFRSSISLTSMITLDTKLDQIELATQLRIELNDADLRASLRS